MRRLENRVRRYLSHGSSTAEIRVTQDEACLRVEIADAGKGIPPEKGSRPHVVGSCWGRAPRNAGTVAAVGWNSAHPVKPRHAGDCHPTRSRCDGCSCYPRTPQGRSGLREGRGRIGVVRFSSRTRLSNAEGSDGGTPRRHPLAQFPCLRFMHSTDADRTYETSAAPLR